MAFNNYLEEENDKPYFTKNSLAYYYDKMEGFAKAVEGSAKALNLTKEEVEKRITFYIEQNKNELDQRLADWDGKLETFDSSVENLLMEWVDDGTLTHVIDSTLIDQKIAPVTAQLMEKAQLDEVILKSEGVGLNNAKPDLLAAIQNIEGQNTFNLLSIPRPKSVTPKQTNFMNIDSKNIYDYRYNTDGVRFNSTGGEIEDAAYSSSDAMNVTGGTYIIAFPTAPKPYDISRLPFYNPDGTFHSVLSGGNTFTSSSEIEITVPSTGIIRVSTTVANKMDMVITRKENYSGFFPATYSINEHIKTIPKDGSVGNAELKSKAVSIENVDFVKESTNKFNKDVAPLAVNSYATYLGGYVTNVNYDVYSIPVKSGEKYILPFYPVFFGANTSVTFYDALGRYVSHVNPNATTDGAYPITVPTNSLIISMKFNVAKVDKNTFMLIKGESYPVTYISHHDALKENFMLNETQMAQIIEKLGAITYTNPLSEKIAVFDGDSICAGTSAGDGLSGWAGRIGTRNGMIWENKAKGGGTITAETYSGATPRHWISRNIDNLRSDADYIILEGGTNDADVVPTDKIGTISVGYTAVLDDTTICGAVETLFRKAIIKYPGKRIGFIIAHKMGAETASTRRQTFDLIIEICKKWGIPYIDLWRGSYINGGIPENKAIMYTDSQHLSSAGYEYITPMIESWMKTL